MICLCQDARVRKGLSQVFCLSTPVVTLLLLALSGCAESIREYVKISDWSPAADRPMVISGSPNADADAFASATHGLNESDWRVLEGVAPRPAWERLFEARDRLMGTNAPGAPGPPDAPAGATPEPQTTPELPPDARVTTLPDGRVHIFYALRHFGGAKVVTAREGGTDRRKVTVTPPDLAPAVELVTLHLAGKGTVTPLPSQNALAITCDAALKDSLLQILAGMDRPTNQVEISARIFEVSNDFDFQVGAKLLLSHISGDNSQGLATKFSAKDFVGAVVNPLTGSVPDPGGAVRLLNAFSSAGITLDATFQALAKNGLVRVVASPRLTVTAGQTAYMLAGQELPIQSAKISNDKFVTEKITYKPIGVQLYITPQIISNHDVKLHVVTTVSAISGFAPTPTIDEYDINPAIINPVLDSREAETYVNVADGNTLVIGGLRMVRTVTRESKVPGLGDIKYLEWLFKNHRTQKQVNDLYFFVTPRLIR
jgi:type II secretory pathway component HofQ